MHLHFTCPGTLAYSYKKNLERQKWFLTLKSIRLCATRDSHSTFSWSNALRWQSRQLHLGDFFRFILEQTSPIARRWISLIGSLYICQVPGCGLRALAGVSLLDIILTHMTLFFCVSIAVPPALSPIFRLIVLLFIVISALSLFWRRQLSTPA